jgi:hypothetical protein
MRAPSSAVSVRVRATPGCGASPCVGVGAGLGTGAASIGASSGRGSGCSRAITFAANALSNTIRNAVTQESQIRLNSEGGLVGTARV